jgi:hypothetical protein
VSDLVVSIRDDGGMNLLLLIEVLEPLHGSCAGLVWQVGFAQPDVEIKKT